MTLDARPATLSIRQDFFVPNMDYDAAAAVPVRELANSIHKSKTSIVKDAIAAHKELTELVYLHLPDDMQNSYRDHGEFPTIATMISDVHAQHGEMPEDIRKSLQDQLLIPINLDEDPTSYVKKHEGLYLAIPAPYIDSYTALIKTDLLLDSIAAEESVSLHLRSCVRREYPDPLFELGHSFQDCSFLKFATNEMRRHEP
jgi:hypothetical protein